MKKTRRGNEGLAASVARLPSPASYSRGLPRWPGALPDNVLLFSRLERHQLERSRIVSHFHHRWVLICCLAGAGTVLRDRKAVRLKPGHALLIPPLHLHHYDEIATERITWLFITFDWPGQTAVSSDAMSVAKIGAAARRRMDSIVAQWLAPGGPEGTLLSAEIMALVLALFPKLGDAEAAARPTETDDLLAAVQRELNAAEQGRPSIAELAGKLHISPSHLRAIFRERTGISLGRYLRESRIREAALLLRTQNLSVKETAERLGFRDIYSFSQSFKRAMGMPPSRLRERA